MKVYHYTSLEKYREIQKRGMIPYLIDKKELFDIGIPSPHGIWVWAQRLSGLSHIGAVLYQASMKGCTRVVELEIQLDIQDLFRHGGSIICLRHHGTIGNLVYHKKERAFIVLRPITPERIRLIDTYNINNIFNR